MSPKRIVAGAGGTLLAILLTFSLASPAHAQIGLTIQPVKIDETLTPGQSVDGNILLTNSSNEPVNVAVSVQDFVPVADADNIQFVGRAPGVTSVSDWITVGSDKTFSFAQGESKSIPYHILAPKNAEPGGHFGVIFFKASEQGTNSDSLKVGTQVGMLVLVSVPGNHLEKGQILHIKTQPIVTRSPVSFGITFHNTGTVHFEPRGSITIRNMFGRSIGTVPIDGQVVLPTSIKLLNESWLYSGFLIGRYSYDATIVDSNNEVLTTYSGHFWAFPTWYVAGFFITIIVLFFLIRFLKSKVRISINVS